MKKRTIPVLIATSLALGSLAAPGYNVLANDQVKGSPSYIVESWDAPEGLSKQDVLYQFLQSKVLQPQTKSVVSIEAAKNQFKIIQEEADSKHGSYHFRTVEQLGGVPVYGSEQTIALDSNNDVKAFFGSVSQNLSKSAVPTEASVSKEEALETVKTSIDGEIGKVSDYDGIESELIIYPHEGKYVLSYLVKASTSVPAPGYFHYFVDATTGEVINHYNEIQDATKDFKSSGEVTPSYVKASTRALPPATQPVQARGMDMFGNLQTFNAVKDMANGTHYLFDGTRANGIHTFKANQMPPNTFIILSALFGLTGFEVTSPKSFFYDPAAVSAHLNAGKVFDYYKTKFARNSLDNNGMKLISTVHIGEKWNNAAWNGKQMLYGDGDGERMISLSGGLDVIGHEMTHGVIDRTADLVYKNESGAINESLADIMGSFVENKTGDDLWLLGEDIWTPNRSGDGLRDMKDPASVYIGGYTESGYYPDHYDDRYLGDLDNGGVHINSSINNKAAYLLTDGGTHHGVEVTGIGKAKAEKIYYRALTLYLTATSGFSEMRQAAIQAARDLYPDRNGESSAEVKAVEAAYDAVGVE
ncbi:M4 family metallopeptidase [Rossellomorea vietnamensis]|uniref:M4 family metallopeptidase n=1 Tax=Rossellomorea vietnamensis TaxID=218284 RepID=UPI0009EE1BE7|nr:M4 family metallopeptidase [Rossellomorea vietnamensis]